MSPPLRWCKPFYVMGVPISQMLDFWDMVFDLAENPFLIFAVLFKIRLGALGIGAGLDNPDHRKTELPTRCLVGAQDAAARLIDVISVAFVEDGLDRGTGISSSISFGPGKNHDDFFL